MFNFWKNSIRNQLIISMALTHAVMMSIFVVDLVQNQNKFLHKQYEQETVSLSKMFAVNSTSWVLANDYIGLQEVVDSARILQNVNYALVLDEQGKVLAHSELKYVSKYIQDEHTLDTLKNGKKSKIVFQNKEYISVMSPILLESKQLGWVKIQFAKNQIASGLEKVLWDGVLYILLAVIIGMLIAFYMGINMTKSIYKIIDTIKRAKAGEIGYRTNSKRDDEIGVLSNEFDNLLGELNDEKNRFRLARESTNDGLWDWDIVENEVYFSHNYKKMLGYKETEMESSLEMWKSLIHEDDIEEIEKNLFMYLNSEIDTYEHEFRMKHKNGSWIWILTRGKALFNEEKKAIRMIGFHTDITQKKNYENELEKLVKKQTMENIKQFEVIQEQTKLASMGEMIGSIAHQWRQPLNELGINIQSLKYNLKNNEIDEEFIKNFIDRNKHIIYFMSETIDDFRNFFRVDKVKEEFYIDEVIQKTVSIAFAQLKNNHIDFSLQGEATKILGFPREFQQVILNLINNAKDALIETGTKDPYIKITLEKNTVTVEDNGGGIPSVMQDRIFEPYFTTKEQGKGTGMGLYMCKMIIENNMQGSLNVSSKDGVTQFEITFED